MLEQRGCLGPQTHLPKGKSPAAGQGGDTFTLESHRCIRSIFFKNSQCGAKVENRCSREGTDGHPPGAKAWVCRHWELPSAPQPSPQGWRVQLSPVPDLGQELAGGHQGSRLEFQGCYTFPLTPPKTQGCYIMFRALSHCECLW